MSTAIRPDILRHICKEPLAEVESLQLRGRGIERLIGLGVCLNLTSLDLSWNAVTDLDEACLEGCKELWVIDASHNHLENVGTLPSFMALGYLDLSNNQIPIEALGPLARAHILELRVGCCAEERREVLNLVPNAWVLDEEYVTAEERRIADGFNEHSRQDGTATTDDLLVCNDHMAWKSTKHNAVRDDGTADSHQAGSASLENRPRQYSACHLTYQDLERQGRRTREFYDNVVWRLPYRTDAADPFRLATLLERYDERVVVANKSAWRSTFTHGSAGGGRARREWSSPLPRPHARVLLSLPVNLKLDVAVLLAVQAAFRDTIPQQILAEAFLVLLVPQSGVPGGIHDDLSRVPPFICTALVHALRSAILQELHQFSDTGRVDTFAPPLLDRAGKDLLEALPPVVTGIHNAFDSWETSQREAETGWTSAGDPQLKRLGGRSDGRTDTPAESPRWVSAPEEPRVPLGSEIDTPSMDQESRRAGKDKEPQSRSEDSVKDTELSTGGMPSAAPAAECGSHPGPEGYVPPPGVGLTRLCRRAVILLTRSPTCPDLVERQMGSASQRTYDQMEPLLVRANMSYRDFHPGSPFREAIGDDNRNYARDESRTRYDGHVMPSGPEACGVDDPVDVQPTIVEDTGSIDASEWCRHVRLPREGERVQVLQNTWSVIISACPEAITITVAPFEGLHCPPYRGEPQIDSRDLCYDPRGWWRHAQAMHTITPAASGRLHRPSRGLSSSGLRWGAGSLNEPLGGVNGGRISSDGGTLGTLTGNIAGILPGPGTCQPSARPATPGVRGALVSTNGMGLASRDPDIAPPSSIALADRRPNSVLDIFSAGGSWDPVFVLAPDRLIGMQNEAAVREKGSRRAKRVAWHRIDGPEASVAPRPMMPRCFSYDASAERGTRPTLLLSASVPGLGKSLPGFNARSSPTRFATVAPSHGGSFSKCYGLTSSAPCIAAAAAAAAAAHFPTGKAWLELQREMGTLKAENRLGPRGRRRGKRCDDGGNAVESGNAHTVQAQGSAMSLLTKSFSSEGIGNGAALAKALSLGLDSPASAWPSGRGNMMARDISDAIETTVFELTQVGQTASSEEENPTAVFPSPTAEMKTETESNDASQAKLVAAPPETRGGTRNFREGTKSPHPCRRRRRPRQDRLGVTAATWKPNTCRPLEWYTVPGRQKFLVDPSCVSTVADAEAGQAGEFPWRGDTTSSDRDREGSGGGSGGDDFGGEFRNVGGQVEVGISQKKQAGRPTIESGVLDDNDSARLLNRPGVPSATAAVAPPYSATGEKMGARAGNPAQHWPVREEAPEKCDNPYNRNSGALKSGDASPTHSLYQPLAVAGAIQQRPEAKGIFDTNSREASGVGPVSVGEGSTTLELSAGDRHCDQGKWVGSKHSGAAIHRPGRLAGRTRIRAGDAPPVDPCERYREARQASNLAMDQSLFPKSPKLVASPCLLPSSVERVPPVTGISSSPPVLREKLPGPATMVCRGETPPMQSGRRRSPNFTFGWKDGLDLAEGVCGRGQSAGSDRTTGGRVETKKGIGYQSSKASKHGPFGAAWTRKGTPASSHQSTGRVGASLDVLAVHRRKGAAAQARGELAAYEMDECISIRSSSSNGYSGWITKSSLSP